MLIKPQIRPSIRGPTSQTRIIVGKWGASKRQGACGSGILDPGKNIEKLGVWRKNLGWRETYPRGTVPTGTVPNLLLSVGFRWRGGQRSPSGAEGDLARRTPVFLSPALCWPCVGQCRLFGRCQPRHSGAAKTSAKDSVAGGAIGAGTICPSFQVAKAMSIFFRSG